MTLRIGVLISGRGSNLGALLDAKASGKLPLADFALVASNRPEALGLAIAERHGIPTAVIPNAEFKGRRAEHDAAMDAALRDAGCQAVVLAGYMRILTEDFVAGWAGRMINIHPSLLPSFPGLDAQRQAVEAGVRVSGCTVHFVDAGVDSGPIILQRAVPVRQDDDEASLSARILEQEHAAIVEAVELLSSGRLRIEGRRVIVLPEGNA